MKRLMIRIAALTTVVVLGAITIAQAQRSLSTPAEVAETPDVAAESIADESPTPKADVASLENSLSTPTIEYRGQTADEDADDDIPDAHELGGLQTPPPATRYAEPAAPGAVRDPFGLGRGETTAPPADDVPTDTLPAYESTESTTPATPVADRRYGESQRLSPPDELNAREPATEDSQWDEEPGFDQEPSQYAQPASDRFDDRYAYQSQDSAGAAQPLDEATEESPLEAEMASPRRAAPPASDPFEAGRAQTNVLRRASSESPADELLTEPQADPAQQAFDEPRASSATPSEGTGRPGPQELEGVQIPTLSVQKTAPEEVQVGKTTTLKIDVHNIGQVSAHDVTLHDEVPQGARLVTTNPAASQSTGGKLSWSLGTLRPGDQATIEIQLVPTREGELGSVATLQFAASASARTLATQPALSLDVQVARQAMIGEQVSLTIDVHNSGSGTARQVIIDQPLPAGLSHPAGNALEYEVGDLAPGESRQIELVLDAAQAGPTSNLMQLRSEDQVHAEQAWELEIVAPALQVAIEGSKRRFLEREATYTIAVANPGTAPARDIELVTYLPAGMKFVEANNYGQYDAQQNAVFWSLEELPMNEKGHVTLTAIPTEAGEQRLKIHGTAERGLSAEQEETILVEGVAAILFQVVDLADPIEVGGETNYEIQVLNQGTSSAHNIRLRAILPEELKPLSAEGPTRHLLDGQVVTFDPLVDLAPKAETTYRIRATALRAGDSRIKVQLLTDELQSPVTKEESTRVFAPEQ